LLSFRATDIEHLCLPAGRAADAARRSLAACGTIHGSSQLRRNLVQEGGALQPRKLLWAVVTLRRKLLQRWQAEAAGGAGEEASWGQGQGMSCEGLLKHTARQSVKAIVI
jgi:hypothetical protein